MDANTNPQNSDSTNPQTESKPAAPERDLSAAGIQKSASDALSKAFVIYRVFLANYAGKLGTVKERADHYQALRESLKPRGKEEETYVELMVIGLATKLEAIGAFGMDNAHPTTVDELMREGERGYWKAHNALERRRRAERAEQAKAERAAAKKASEQTKISKTKGHEQETVPCVDRLDGDIAHESETLELAESWDNGHGSFAGVGKNGSGVFSASGKATQVESLDRL